MESKPALQTRKTRHILVAALAVYAAATILSGFRSDWNLVDDALILCRYGSNVAAGHGVVYNPGERVEAHSSPLWVALLALGARGGLDLPFLTRSLGVLAGAGVIALAAFSFVAVFPPFLALLLTLMIAGDAGLSLWGIAGLETNGFTLILFAVWVVLRAALGSPDAGLRLLLGGLAGLLALARPEGAALGALAVSISCIKPARDRSGRISAVAPFVLVLGALVAWRFSYYGSWLPTSVSAKFLLRQDALALGLADTGAFLLRRWPLVFCALSSIVNIRRSPCRPELWSVSAGLACLFLIVEFILAGGDWMGRDRIPGPMLPLLAMLAGFGIQRMSKRTAPTRSLLVLLAAAVVSFSWWHSDWIPQHQRRAVLLGEWLRRSFPADTRIGVAAAGTVPFHSGFYTIDALGISSPGIAATPPPEKAEWKPGHMRYDTRKFLASAPDVVIWEFGTRWCQARLAEPARDPDRRGGDFRRELLWSQDFRTAYRIMPGSPAETEGLYTVFQRIGGDGSVIPDPNNRPSSWILEQPDFGEEAATAPR